MTPQTIIDRITADYDGVVPKASWGETSLFYNPGHKLPNGVYFCTLKEKDGANDKASQLDRPGIFRLSIGVGPAHYEALFGPRPERPSKGGVVATGHDFTAVNQVMPHPVYGWMGWVHILNPAADQWQVLHPLITTAYQRAVKKFNKKVGNQS